MAPIPVYANSPITAAKADGVTPKTASPEDQSKMSQASSSMPTSAYTPSAYPAAQPGAAPSLPAPTGQPQAQPYAPVQPTPTTAIASESPAPPQPASVPASHLPPPPKAGEKYQPPTQTAAPSAATIRYPAQMAIPAPTASYPAQQHGTSTATAASSSLQGTQMPLAAAGGMGENAQAFSHPAGYQQNANASQLDQYRRSAMEQPEPDDGGEGIWGTAKKLAQQTGERLAAAESEVWKKISKDQ
ncbi:hypothetical protein F4808DRAFT_431802 [Astrocystis sublimbata]|nr:hypothetical protein F4808DRAFT_431802 [Astrocystis sublimbata]